MELKTIIIIRNDSTVNWNANSSVVLAKGEMGIEFTAEGTAKIKIGDGVKTWAELDYFGGENTPTQVYEAITTADETDMDAIARVVGAAVLNQGDIAIVKRAIANDKYEHTAYVYADAAWKAMDGNYNAENVYFDKDLLTTSAIGNIKLTNGQATIAAQGKNLKQLFDTIFVKEENPTTVQPSVTVTSTQAKAYEVGTTVTPAYNSTFNAGSYKFGPATGVTVTSWEVSDSDGNTATTEDGTFPDIVVGDATSYKVTAKANHTDGAIPVTNTGNEYPAAQIKAGSKTASTSTAISGYRNSFYGTFATKDVVDSAAIRTLTKSNRALANGATFDVTVPVGAMRVVIAYPATLRDVTSVIDTVGMNTDIKGSFVKSTVSVEGANGYTAVDYKVFTLDFALANDAANRFTVTI